MRQAFLVQAIVKTTQEFVGEHQEDGFELLSFVCLLGELHAEILADEGAVPFVQLGDLFPFLYLQLAGIHIDQHMRMVAVQTTATVV